MHIIKILFRRNSSQPNQEIIEFLHTNIEKIIAAGFRFEFRTVSDDKIPDLIKAGIISLPVCDIEGKRFSGSSDIICMLIKCTSRPPVKKSSKKDPNDEIRDYMMDEMSEEAIARDKETVEKDEMGDAKRKAEAIMKERAANIEKTKSSKRDDNITTKASQPKRPPAELKSDDPSGDEDMISKMFESTPD